MAEIDRKRRFAARLKQLMKVAIEQKNVAGGVSLARMVLRLEGWSSTDDPIIQEEPQKPIDMSSLLETLETDSKTKI